MQAKVGETLLQKHSSQQTEKPRLGGVGISWLKNWVTKSPSTFIKYNPTLSIRVFLATACLLAPSWTYRTVILMDVWLCKSSCPPCPSTIVNLYQDSHPNHSPLFREDLKWVKHPLQCHMCFPVLNSVSGGQIPSLLLIIQCLALGTLKISWTNKVL